MELTLTTVADVAAAVAIGLLPWDRAVELLTENGFTGADGILRDLVPTYERTER